MKKTDIETMIRNLPEEPEYIVKCNEAIVKGFSKNHTLKAIPLSDEIESLPTYAIPSSIYLNINLKDINPENLRF